MKLVRLLFVVPLTILTVGCGGDRALGPKSQGWVPSLQSFATYPHAKELLVTDPSGVHRFSVEVRSLDPNLLASVRAEDFELTVLDSTNHATTDADGAGVGIDGQGYRHDAAPKASRPVTQPPLFVKVHYLNGEEPAAFSFRAKRLPVREYAGVVNAGHYKSIVLRRYNKTNYAFVRFYHHHGDWSLHTLWEGWYLRCAYAYDCYPGHSIPSWYSTDGTESIEFRADCYGRCP